MSSEDGVIAGSGAVGDRSRNHFETGSTWPVLSCFSPRAFQGISVYLHRVRLGLDSVSLLASDLPARRSFGWKFVHVVTQAMGSPNIPSLTINIQCCFFSLETQDWFFVGRMTCLFHMSCGLYVLANPFTTSEFPKPELHIKEFNAL